MSSSSTSPRGAASDTVLTPDASRLWYRVAMIGPIKQGNVARYRKHELGPLSDVRRALSARVHAPGAPGQDAP